MKKQGFTLIELMSVIVLLGLIVALVFPNVVDVVQKKQKEISESKLKIIVLKMINHFLVKLN